MGKQRLSVSVDADLIQTAERAVADGRAANVSAWVNEALRLEAERGRKLEALGELIGAYEAEHGVITPAEIRSAKWPRANSAPRKKRRK